MKTQNIILLLIGLILVGFVSWLSLVKTKQAEPLVDVFSFEDCTSMGYLVSGLEPRQCKTPDGRTFAEELPENITYVNASPDLIKVELPFPGAVTGKDFIVVGEARGNWFFEASFPIDVLDKDGKILVQTFATAQDEWMTENFVHFRGDVKIPKSYIGPATLVLRKDNASGLPEHDAHISFPITIEY